jgi:hypothetical protein
LPSTLAATVAGSLVTIGVNVPSDPGNLTWLQMGSLGISWLVAALTATNTFLRPYETSQGHREKAGSYDVLLGQIVRAQTFDSDDELKLKLEEIDKKIEELKMSEPFLSDKRIRASKQQLEKKGGA